MTTLHISSISEHKMSAIGDPMELSLEMDHRRQMADEDIDIDLDLTGDQPLDGEDDYMAEDVNLAIDEASFGRQLAHVGRDDEMLDDEYSLEEAEDAISVHDEDLGDAAYPVLEEPVELLAELSAEHSREPRAEWPSDTFQGQEIGVTVNDSHPQPDSRPDHSKSRDATLSQPPDELILDTQRASQGDDRYEAQELLHGIGSIPKLSNDTTPADFEAETVIVTRNIDSDWVSTTPNDEDEGQIHSPDQEDTIATPDDFETLNEIASAVATYVHPVTVVYQGSEMSLFPPADEDLEHSQTYLLHDERLASESIMHLFGACRSVLADSIEEDDELEITVGDLGLQISESATECSSTALGQIIDLYVQLHRNDGIDNPAALHLALSTRVKFSHRFDYLLSAVAEGKGLQLILFEGAEERDQQSENLLEQEDTQGSSSEVPKPISGAEREVNSSKDVNAGEDQPNLTLQHVEDLKPDPQHYVLGGQPDIPPEEKYVIANYASQLEENQTSNGPSDTLDGGPNNMHQAGDSINGAFESDLNAIPMANKDQDAVEEQDLIFYEDDDNLNPGTSTGSSTIQGDVREVTVVSSNQLSREPASATIAKSNLSTNRDIESNSSTALVGRSSTPSILADAFEDDFDYTAHIEINEERPSDERGHDDPKPGDVPDHHLKTDSATDFRGYGQDPKEVRNSNNVQVEEPQVSVESSYDDDLNSSYALMDSNFGVNLTRTESKGSDVQRSAGSESARFDSDEASIVKIPHSTVDSNEFIYNNSSDQNPPNEVVIGQYENRVVDESTFHNLRSTSNTQEQLADSDEITYEDDGNEPEPSKVDSSEQNPSSSPSLLKRMRGNNENHDEIDSSVHDAKRHRPG